MEFKELYELSEKTSYGNSKSISELINDSIERNDWEMLNFIKSNTYLVCSMTSQSLMQKRYTATKLQNMEKFEEEYIKNIYRSK